jgi:hypothetical protein
MDTFAPRRTAALWVEYNAAVSLYARAFGGTRRLRYEDFAAAPEQVVNGLMETLSLEERTDRPCEGHSFSGNPMRFDSGSIRVTLDEGWKREMPTRERRLVTAMTAPLLRHYGYRLQ